MKQGFLFAPSLTVNRSAFDTIKVEIWPKKYKRSQRQSVFQPFDHPVLEAMKRGDKKAAKGSKPYDFHWGNA